MKLTILFFYFFLVILKSASLYCQINEYDWNIDFEVYGESNYILTQTDLQSHKNKIKLNKIKSVTQWLYNTNKVVGTTYPASFIEKYDNFGNIVERVEFDTESTVLNRETYLYDKFENIKEVELRSSSNYSGVIKHENQNSLNISKYFDSFGFLEFEKQYKYDSLENLIEIRFISNNETVNLTSFDYDLLNNIISCNIFEYPDANNRTSLELYRKINYSYCQQKLKDKEISLGNFYRNSNGDTIISRKYEYDVKNNIISDTRIFKKHEQSMPHEITILYTYNEKNLLYKKEMYYKYKEVILDHIIFYTYDFYN
ncbi:hypothetical protein BH10BAC5_BH10BAC5_10370 [soil metagenome]